MTTASSVKKKKSCMAEPLVLCWVFYFFPSPHSFVLWSFRPGALYFHIEVRRKRGTIEGRDEEMMNGSR